MGDRFRQAIAISHASLSNHQPAADLQLSDKRARAMAETVRAQLGGAEILVNCAAMANTGPMSDDMLDEQINVKVKATCAARGHWRRG